MVHKQHNRFERAAAEVRGQRRPKYETIGWKTCSRCTLVSDSESKEIPPFSCDVLERGISAIFLSITCPQAALHLSHTGRQWLLHSLLQAMASPKIAVAILDDYQHVALTMADWSAIQDRITIDVFDDTLSDVDELAKRLAPYTVICAMRERTKFNAVLLDRLPNLKLIATTGMVNRGIDVKYAASKGIAVSGTGSNGDSTLEHIWALLLATVRHIALEDANVKQSSPRWQTHIPLALAGHTLGLVGVGRLGAATARVSSRS